MPVEREDGNEIEDKVYQEDPNYKPHEWGDDACCVHCGFDGAEWWHWKKYTHEGRASTADVPSCKGHWG